MTNFKDVLIEDLEERAFRRVGQLAGELVRSKPQDKEVVLAQLQFERWLAESCQECLQTEY